MDLGLGQRRRLHEPPEQRPRFVVRAELHERIDDEVGIADPAEAIVPVARSTNGFGKRCRRGGDIRSRGRKDQRLQQQRAAHHLIAPRSVDRPDRRPLLPERNRRIEPRLQLAARRKHERLGMRGADRQQGALPRFEIERRADAAAIPGWHAGIPARNGHRFGAACGHRNAAPPFRPRPTGSVMEPRRKFPAHRDGTREAFHRADELAHRREAPIRNRQRVDHAHRAAVGDEGRLEDIGVRQVPARAVEPDGRLQCKRSAAPGVDDRRKHAGRVEIRQAQPVDGAVARHERGRAAVTDQCVVFDRGIPVDAHRLSVDARRGLMAAWRSNVSAYRRRGCRVSCVSREITERA